MLWRRSSRLRWVGSATGQEIIDKAKIEAFEDSKNVSRTDMFSKYTAIYQKANARETVPDGPFVRQLSDIPVADLDVGVFFKGKRDKVAKQVYIGRPIPEAVSKREGFLEADDVTYLCRDIFCEVQGLQYLRLAISAGSLLDTTESRTNFLKKCQRIIDTFVRKARNIMQLGLFSPFRMDLRITTLGSFLEETLKLDDVGVEAASIPFNVAGPKYVTMSNNDIMVIGDEPRVGHGVFHLVGGIGYTFDKSIGAVQEERLFRTTTDLASLGITEVYVDSMLSNITSDFQNNVHSVVYSDIWRKSEVKPKAVNFGDDLLIRANPSSDMWSGVFEVYLKQPKA